MPVSHILASPDFFISFVVFFFVARNVSTTLRRFLMRGPHAGVISETAAALVFTGHLRDTCDRKKDGIIGLLNQTRMCREAFHGRCDVFIYTWSTLEKAAAPYNTQGRTLLAPSNSSSWACLEAVSRALEPTVVSAVVQPARPEVQPSMQSWGRLGESLASFRMNSAAVIGGLDLMRSYASSMRVNYSAVARMRLDMGSRRWTRFGHVFLAPMGWANIRSRADEDARGGGQPGLAREVSTCDVPRVKLTDFCMWSSPPAALLDAFEELRGGRFDSLILGGGGAAPCDSLLNRSAPLRGLSDRAKAERRQREQDEATNGSLLLGGLLAKGVRPRSSAPVSRPAPETVFVMLQVNGCQRTPRISSSVP